MAARAVRRRASRIVPDVARWLLRHGGSRAAHHVPVAGAPRLVTVMHSDIVASTSLVERAGSRYPRLLVRHRALIARAVGRSGGRFLSHSGDGTMAVFDRADDAVVAAVEAQRALAAERWPDGLVPRVRMGVHTGEVHEVAGEPVGLAINRGARIMAAAQPGQVMVSTAAAAAARRDGLSRAHGISMGDAGWHFLRDHNGPVRLRQLVADGVTVVVPDPAPGRHRAAEPRARVAQPAS
jgi:class 3 adenylate cyclase